MRHGRELAGSITGFLMFLSAALCAQESGGMPAMGATPGMTAYRPPAESLRTAEQVTRYLRTVAEGATPNLDGLDLTHLDFRGVDFRRATLIGTRLQSAQLDSANLFSCDLTDARASGASFIGANMDVSTLRRADLPDTETFLTVSFISRSSRTSLFSVPP